MKSDDNSPGNYQEKKDLFQKDITDDVLDFEISDLDDGPAGDPAASPTEKGDHPALAMLDMALKVGGDYCSKNKLPPPNTSLYEGFSRPFLNEALWHYMPDGGLPDDPRIALALGVAGLGLACAPTVIELHKRREEEEKKRLEKKRRPAEDVDPDPADPDPVVNPHPGDPPSWMDRLSAEAGGLPGM